MSNYKRQTQVGQVFGSWKVISNEFKLEGKPKKVVIIEELANGKNQKIIQVGNLLNLRMLPSKTPENKSIYSIANGILQRCNNENHPFYKHYGGRGIKCLLGSDRYTVYQELLKIPGWFEGASIDRLDANGHYTLFNLKWSTSREQANNRSNNNETPGVSFNNHHKAWQARVQLPNKTRLTKSFSIKKYGDQEAHSLALAYREEIKKEYGV